MLDAVALHWTSAHAQVKTSMVQKRLKIRKLYQNSPARQYRQPEKRIGIRLREKLIHQSAGDELESHNIKPSNIGMT